MKIKIKVKLDNKKVREENIREKNPSKQWFQSLRKKNNKKNLPILSKIKLWKKKKKKKNK